MNKIIAFFYFFIPHPFNRLLRRLTGQKVAKSARIHIFSFIFAKHLKIGERSTISPFTFLKTSLLHIGNDVHIAPFVIVNAPILEGADFKVDEFSRIFPFCWLEPGEGIRIGKHVGIGGHTLIFTHGVWSNFLQGGPVNFGPVVLEDHVWIPWRVFIMPNVRIGKGSIIGANSTVTKNVPDHSLAAGSPAKLIKENINQGIDQANFYSRCDQVIKSYAEYCLRSGREIDITSEDVKFNDLNKSWGQGKKIEIDLDSSRFRTNTNYSPDFFIGFLRRYGIRVQPWH